MKLFYDILWFEDQPAEIKPAIESLEYFVAEAGLKLRCDIRDTVSLEDVGHLSEKLRRYNPYDLIVFDYDMGASVGGPEIARDLRSQVYTDMIFYSGKSIHDLRRVVFDAGVDGVFVVTRLQLAEQLRPIVDDQIRRVCDINVMRGLVMDEVARSDRLMRDLSCKILKNSVPAARATFLDRLKKRLLERSVKTNSDINGIVDEIDAIWDFRLVDFNTVRQRLMRLCKDRGIDGGIFADDKPLALMQNLRNRLAHLEGEIDSNGVMRLSDKGSEDFDHDRFEEIRRNLLSIRSELDKISLEVPPTH